MFPLIIYAGTAALGVAFANAVSPSEVLNSNHHRRLYWTGVVTAIVIVGGVVNAILA